MANTRHIAVVILYRHPLLGQGIARLLTAHPGLDVTLVGNGDRSAAEDALGTGPDVVVLERGAPMTALDVIRVAPDALLIDIGMDSGPTWTYRREPIGPEPDVILRTIRRLQCPAPPVEGDEPADVVPAGAPGGHR